MVQVLKGTLCGVVTARNATPNFSNRPHATGRCAAGRALSDDVPHAIVARVFKSVQLTLQEGFNSSI